MNKGLATKKAILREALALVSRIGFEAVSIAQLAEAVGLSKSGLYAHFRDKEGLQLELLDEATELFRETVISPAREAPAGEPRVRAIFSNWMHWAELEELPGGCIFMTAANEFADRPGALRDALVTRQKSWLSFLTKTAREAVEVGDFRGDLDTGQFARELYGIALAYKYFDKLMGDEAAEASARASFERLLSTSRPTP